MKQIAILATVIAIWPLVSAIVAVSALDDHGGAARKVARLAINRKVDGPLGVFEGQAHKLQNYKTSGHRGYDHRAARHCTIQSVGLEVGLRRAGAPPFKVASEPRL